MSLPSGFSDGIKTMPDEEVLAILARPEDYLPEAVELARTERSTRGLTEAKLVVAKVAAEAIEEQAALKAKIPLSTGMKWFCFIFPLNIWMVFAAVSYAGTGFKRKADDVSLWMGCGFFFYFFLAISISLLTSGR